MVVGVASDPVLTRLVEDDKKKWYQKKHLRYLYFLLFPTCMGIEVTSGFDSQLINSLQGVSSWKQYFGKCVTTVKAGKSTVECGLDTVPALKGIIGASYNLGAICALPFVGIFTERFGRRTAIAFGSSAAILGAIIQGAAQNVGMYIIARMLLGFGIAFCIINGSSMLGELGYPKERATLTALFNSSYFVGSITAAGITMGTNFINGDSAWRIPSYLQMVPSIVQLALVYLLPESPRWLISKDRRDEAFDILVKYHAEGDRDNFIVKAEMAQIETTVKMELEAANLSYLDLLRSAAMRRRAFLAMAIGFFTQWSGNTLISYYFFDLLKMIGVTESKTQQAINVGKEAWSLINANIIALIVTNYKRRTMYLTCAASMLIVYIGWTTTMGVYLESVVKNTKNKSYNIAKNTGKATIFFIFLYSPAYNIGYNALTYTYLVEIFPFAERTRGIACFQFFGRGAGFFTTFVNPIGLTKATWKYMIMYCAWISIELVVIYFSFPETYNRTLEELSFIFEGQELKDKQTIAVEKRIHADEQEPIQQKVVPPRSYQSGEEKTDIVIAQA